jgi:hypothetical protein
MLQPRPKRDLNFRSLRKRTLDAIRIIMQVGAENSVSANRKTGQM